MYHLVLVALGGALGSGLRHLVNIAGGFLMGLFVELLARRFGGSAELRLFVATGVLGGFTTFSAFSLDVAVLYERGAVVQAFAYVAASVIVAIAALFLGMWLAKTLA
jgi:CrcB protein